MNNEELHPMTVVATTVTRKAVAIAKPFVKATFSMATRHPEAVAAGAFGYVVGSKFDDVWAFRKVTGGNAKYIGALVGAVWGYNLALTRRALDIRDERLAQMRRAELRELAPH